MSTLVDERVVEMSFDNSNFEKNVKESMGTINELKSSLDFSNAAKSINQSLESVNMTPITYGLESVKQSFSAWEVIAISTISNLTNKVVNLGTKMVESLSVDNIASGWQKFSENTKSVGTLLAQDGNDIDNVSAALEKLMWFTDQTSYSYTDMVSNISKFTATGQSLEDSVQAMMGIANWAALSGQNAATASRAMYQLSQAMGQGVVRLMDYKSIQNANMDTEEFRRKALETAVDLGYLTRTIDGVYTTTEKATDAGKQFTQSQFTTQLSAGWFSSDVLMKTLQEYSSAVDELYERTEVTGEFQTASEAIEAYEKELEEGGTDTEKFGLKAFKAAQEARTLEDAINATRDAVSSGWLKTFEYIFGNYEEAKSLWTDLANNMWDIFAAGGEVRNNILGIWKETFGGRDDLFDRETGAFWNLFDAIKSITDIIKGAWQSVFGFGKSLDDDEAYANEAAEALKNLTSKLSNSTQAFEDFINKIATPMTGILKGLFSILKFGAKTVGAIFNGIKPLFSLFMSGSGSVITELGSIGESFSDFVDNTTMFEHLTGILSKLSNTIVSIIRKIGSLLAPLKPIYEKLKFYISAVFSALSRIPEHINNFISNKQIRSFGDFIQALSSAVTGSIRLIIDTLSKFGKTNTDDFATKATEVAQGAGAMEAFFDGLKSLLTGLLAVASAVMPVLGAIFELIGAGLKFIGDALKNSMGNNSPMDMIKKIFSAAFLAGAIVTLYRLIDVVSSVLEALRNMVAGFGDVLDSKAMMQYAEALKTFAIAILLLVASLVLLSSMDAAQLAKGFAALAVLTSGMILVMKTFSKMFATQYSSFKEAIFGFAGRFAQAATLKAMAKLILSFALAIGILVVAMKLLSTMNSEQIGEALTTLIVLMAALVSVTLIISKTLKGKNAAVLGAFAVVLLALASALTVLSLDLLILSRLKPSGALQGVAIIGVLMTMFIGISKLIKMQSVGSLLAFAGMMVVLGIAFAELTASISVLALLPIAKAWNAVGIITAFMAAMVFIAKLVGIFSSLKLGIFAAGMFELGKAMAIFAGVIVVLGTMDEDALKRGRETIQFFILAMAGIIKLVGIFSSLKLGVFASGMILLGAAMLEFTMVIRALGGMDVGSLAKAGIFITAFVGILALITKALSVKGSTNLLIFAAGMAAVAASMLLFTLSLAALGALNIGNIVKGLAIMGITLAGLAVLSNVLRPAVIVLIGFGAALTMVATAALMFAAALSLVAGLGATAGIALSMLMTGMLETLINLGPTLSTALEVVITALLTAISNTITKIFEMVGTLIDNVVSLIGDKGPALVAALVMLIDLTLAALAERMPSIARSLVSIVIALLNAVKNSAGRLTQDILDIVFIMLDTLTKNIPVLLGKLETLVTTLVNGVVDTLISLIPNLIDAGFRLIIGLVDGIGESIEKNAGELRDAMGRFCEHLWNAFLNFFGIHSPSTLATTAGTNIIQGIINGITKMVSQAVRALTSLAKDMWNGIKNFPRDFINFGKNIVQGIWNGIKNVWSGFTSFWKNIWNGIVDWFKGLFHINSPSKLFYDFGQYTVEGYRNGLDDESKSVEDSMESLQDTAIDALSNEELYARYGELIDIAIADAILNNGGVIIDSLGAIISTSIQQLEQSKTRFQEVVHNIFTLIQNQITEEDLTIRPTMDLTDIQNGTSDIAAMLSSVSGISIGTSTRLAERASSEMNAKNSSNGNSGNSSSTNNSQNSNQSYNVIFNISNSDPKAVAEEVDKKLQSFVDRRKTQWA